MMLSRKRMAERKGSFCAAPATAGSAGQPHVTNSDGVCSGSAGSSCTFRRGSAACSPAEHRTRVFFNSFLYNMNRDVEMSAQQICANLAGLPDRLGSHAGQFRGAYISDILTLAEDHDMARGYIVHRPSSQSFERRPSGEQVRLQQDDAGLTASSLRLDYERRPAGLDGVCFTILFSIFTRRSRFMQRKVDFQSHSWC